MEKPKINFFNWFAIVCGVATLISAFFPLSTLNIKYKLLIVAVCISASLTYSFIDFYNRTILNYKIHFELYQKHQALAEQFSKKTMLIEDYEMAFDHFGTCIITALTPMKKTEALQITNLFQIFIAHKQKIRGE